ncbi:hypothetical protein BU17DRAFT_96374 [Hysterangium stoloniferum]|nr:hypothetical protein BU17DRAFT_96374 [Hysterangium stoloniferum]
MDLHEHSPPPSHPRGLIAVFWSGLPLRTIHLTLLSSPCLSSDRALSPEPSDGSTSPREVCSSNTPHFLVSDSRSEFENFNAGGKRKTRASLAAAQKRARTLLTDCEE